ncbi:type I polyketide synthase [Embleya sp. AB8]|uniref:type I polyketide synthase n=1 Tax=Embleya sp. AB8 TaxID=3156304 RepID=UPI003C769F6C
MTRSGHHVSNSAIAIVGMSCRLPGAPDPDRLWQVLRDGRDEVTSIPDDARRAGFTGLGDTGVERGGFLDCVDGFDEAFFGISPREATVVDPRQRLALELGWECLEDAGIVPATLRGGRTGVFLGAAGDDYALLTHAAGTSSITAHTVTGLQRGVIANRISYTLGLRGPSMVVDTAQSSSLVAVHLACESLRSNDCSLALAGGVHLNLAPESAVALARFGALSPDGRCATFDEAANGIVRGEGGGLVVLKRLADAIADGDRVRAVVLGGAVNHDGAGPALAAPDESAQREVLDLACARAGVEPGAVQYVELHGTGTPVGDPVEAAAVGAVFGADRPCDRPLLVGSAKTNFGHLEAAAGITGLLKTALALEHGVVPASLHFRTAHPTIPLDGLNLRVPTDSRPWPAEVGLRLAGVSAFGVGGTNCHLVLADRPEPLTSRSESGGADRHFGPAAGPEALASRTESPPGGLLPWVLSARSAAALRAQADRLACFVDEHAELLPADIGRSLAVTRTAFEHRAVVLGRDRASLVAGVREIAAGRGTTGRMLGDRRPVFVFPGQGSHWAGMGLALAEESDVFRERIGECADALSAVVPWSLWDALRGIDGAPPLSRLDVAQPALWAVMVSLAEVWRSFGVRPAAVVGHSQGEVAAACVTGALSLGDAARVVALRSRALAELSGGGMAALSLSRAGATRLVERWPGRLALAAVNGPRSVVVTGTDEAITGLLAACAATDVRAKRIGVRCAGHSAQIEQVRERMLAELAGVVPVSTEVPFYSTVAGGRIDTTALTADYWFRNARQPVLFERTVRSLLAAEHHVFVEVSPHPVLTPSVQDTIDEDDVRAVVVGTLRRDRAGRDQVLTGVATLHVHGVEPDWDATFDPETTRVVRLPGYAFQRRPHWLGTDPAPRAAIPTESRPDLLDLPPGERAAALLDLVREHTAAVLGYDSARSVDPVRDFRDLGFDSAMAVELGRRLRGAGVRVSATSTFDHPSPRALAMFLDAEPAARTQGGHPRQAAAVAVDLSTASDDELFHLIDHEFGKPATY